ncbi:MAG: hypothetical protein L0216_18955 [Planctomycetales bacterium]|nr:hypothetical protein [Planctomycetales bacterium]
MAEEVLILGAARTPVGRLNGALASVSAPELAAVAMKEAARQSGVTTRDITEVYLGCAFGAGLGTNPARKAAEQAGIAPIAAATMAGGRSAGLQAVVLGIRALCGRGPARLASMTDMGERRQLAVTDSLVMAGGMDSSSSSPFLIPDARRGSRLGHARMLDSVSSDAGLPSQSEDQLVLVRQVQVLLESHRRCMATTPAREIAPVEVRGRKGMEKVTRDEGTHAWEPNSMPSSAPPADGAAVVLLARDERARELKASPVGRILAACAGDPPLGPDSGPPWADPDLKAVEVAEDWPPAAVRWMRHYLPRVSIRLNAHGGGLGRGAPAGASGAISLVELISTLRELKGGKGICVAGTWGDDAAAVCIEVFPPA